MTLAAGVRFGPYEIVAPIGAGGMGQVYRARDTRLDRTVAIKVLAPNLVGDSTFRARFEREAKAVAALNHPHICTIHDVGHQNGTDFLVMEYVDGESLSSRLLKGPLPIDDAIQYGIDIASALDRAHRAGIVHRDLKPSNVMVTRSGAKLLDFGLAKTGLVGVPDAGLTAPPTQTSPLTAQGSFLGTLNYMAPEQLEGKAADARSDVFALGVVLYEMVTGRRPFDGASAASVIAAILDADPPPVVRVRPLVPPLLDHVISECLAKDADERWQSAADIHHELQWIAHGGGATPVPATTRRRRLIAAAAWAGAGIVAGAAFAASMLPSARTEHGATALPARFEVRVDETWGLFGVPVISPDGSRIAYVAIGPDGRRHLFTRAIDVVDGTRIQGTEDALHPFFSPDGQWIGFFTWTALKKIPVTGGSAVSITETTRVVRGATWQADGSIVFSATPFSGLLRVSDRGGSIEALTTPRPESREVGHVFPEALPEDRGVLFTIINADSHADSKIAVLAAGDSQPRVLVEGGRHARYIVSGHLMYTRGNFLMAVPFDLRTLETRGQPVQVLQGIRSSSIGMSSFSVSRSGTLAYIEGPDLSGLNSRSQWVGAGGVADGLPNAPPGVLYDPAISPDGKHMAFSVAGANQDIWVHDIARGSWTRLTQDPAAEMGPLWIDEGRRIVFSSGRSAAVDLFSIASDGAGVPQPLFADERIKFATSWSARHGLIAFVAIAPGTREDIWLLDPSKPAKPEPLLRMNFSESAPAFSPDGRWIAYESDETGRYEIYVQPFREPGRKHPISTEGGRHPRWSRRGDELFYINGNRIMVVRVAKTGDLAPQQPRLEIAAKYPYFGLHPNYDVADDRRFLMLDAEVAPPARRIIVVQSWLSELSRRVPRPQ